MILDSFNLTQVIFQVSYSSAFILWDRAGRVAQRFCDLIPDLDIVDSMPNKQVLKGKDFLVQTGLKKSTFTISGSNPFGQNGIRFLKEAFEEGLTLEEIFEAIQKVLKEMNEGGKRSEQTK